MGGGKSTVSDEQQASGVTLVAAWVVVLLASLLPTVVLRELFGLNVSFAFQTAATLGVLAAALAVSMVWAPTHGLRPLVGVLAVLTASQWFVFEQVDRIAVYRDWLADPSFGVWMLAEQSLKLLVAALMIGALLLMGRRREEFFLTLGDLNAPVSPIRWLGVDEGLGWRRLGGWATVCISLGTLAFLVIAGRPSLDLVARALPFLPAILVAAAANAFYEELTYKASLLSVLEGPVGGRQSLAMVAVFFGAAHFYGVPYGLVGVVLAGFLGWLLARSMLETRGMFWAWFVHFWQDVLIFSFLAGGAISPGG